MRVGGKGSRNLTVWLKQHRQVQSGYPYKLRTGSGRGRRFFLKICGILAIPLLLLLGAEWMLGPSVREMAGYQSKVYASRIIHEAVSEELSRQGTGYSQLFTVSKRDTGEVTAIESNVVAINRLQSQLAQVILERLDTREGQGMSLPLGTLTGLDILAGRGPLMGFRILPIGAVETKMSNRFESAGINQTLHRVMLEITADVSPLLPGCRESNRVSVEICIAETVIVGSVPNFVTRGMY